MAICQKNCTTRTLCGRASQSILRSTTPHSAALALTTVGKQSKSPPHTAQARPRSETHGQKGILCLHKARRCVHVTSRSCTKASRPHANHSLIPSPLPLVQKRCALRGRLWQRAITLACMAQHCRGLTSMASFVVRKNNGPTGSICPDKAMLAQVGVCRGMHTFGAHAKNTRHVPEPPPLF